MRVASFVGFDDLVLGEFLPSIHPTNTKEILSKAVKDSKKR
jgi:hypothetical protein